MATTNSIVLGFEYEDGATRNYTFTGMNNSALEDLKRKVLALNTTISDQTAGAPYKETFISDDGAPVTKIAKAKYIVTEEQVIYRG